MTNTEQKVMTVFKDENGEPAPLVQISRKKGYWRAQGDSSECEEFVNGVVIPGLRCVGTDDEDKIDKRMTKHGFDRDQTAARPKNPTHTIAMTFTHRETAEALQDWARNKKREKKEADDYISVMYPRNAKGRLSTYFWRYRLTNGKFVSSSDYLGSLKEAKTAINAFASTMLEQYGEEFVEDNMRIYKRLDKYGDVRTEVTLSIRKCFDNSVPVKPASLKDVRQKKQPFSPVETDDDDNSK